MPLENAPVGSPGFGRNIATEEKAGKPPKQAEAIAYSKARGDAQPATLDSLFKAADSLYAKSDAVQHGAWDGARGDATGSANAEVRRGSDISKSPGVKPNSMWIVRAYGSDYKSFRTKGEAEACASRLNTRKDSDDCAADADEICDADGYSCRREGDEWVVTAKDRVRRLPCSEYKTREDAVEFVKQALEGGAKADADYKTGDRVRFKRSGVTGNVDAIMPHGVSVREHKSGQKVMSPPSGLEKY